MHLKHLFIRKRLSQILIYQKTCIKNVQKRAFPFCLDPIQKCASSMSMQLEALQLKAQLY